MILLTDVEQVFNTVEAICNYILETYLLITLTSTSYSFGCFNGLA